MDTVLKWGEAKGPIRHMYIKDDQSCIYVIEEAPGYRVIRFNKRKYRIFCPWVYFFVKVILGNPLSGPGFFSHGTHCFYVFFSSIQVKSLTEDLLSRAVFPNTSTDGSVCLPPRGQKGNRAIEVALAMIYDFWGSNGNEFHFSRGPGALFDGVPHGTPGKIFGKWSRLEPWRVMRLDFGKTGVSIESGCTLSHFEKF